MSEYSGKNHQAVLAALESAAAILLPLDLGPASREALENWQATDAETKVQAANTFLPFTEVLQMKAALGEDNATSVYRDLCRSGALSGERTPYMQDVEQECAAYLVAEYADLAAGQLNVAPLAYGTRLSDSARGNTEISNQVETLVAQAARGGRQSVRDTFLSFASPVQQDAVKGVLHHITALDQDVRNLERDSGYNVRGQRFQPC